MNQNNAETVHQNPSESRFQREKSYRLGQGEALVITLLVALSSPFLLRATAQEIINNLRTLYSENFNDDDGWESELDRNGNADIRNGELEVYGLGQEELNLVRVPEVFNTPALRVSFTLETIPEPNQGYAVVEIRVQSFSLTNNPTTGDTEAIRLYVNQNVAIVNLIQNGVETPATSFGVSELTLSKTYTLVYLTPAMLGTDVGQLQVLNGSILLIRHNMTLKPGPRRVYLGALALEDTDVEFGRVRISRP